MQDNNECNFLDIFSKIEDPRASRNKLYPMSEILLTAFAAIICGAEGWGDIELFGKSHLGNLKTLLPFKNGAPSDDTFRRFFRALDPKKFQELFREWIQNLQLDLKEKVIAIDGKASRHTFDKDKKMLHTISAFAVDARLVLAQDSVSEKSNEIVAIPKLLEWLDLKRATVTIDAMGCQYAIADQILSKGGDYIFALKGNQEGLLEDVESYFSDEELMKNNVPFETYEKGHGRIEYRSCKTVLDVEWLYKRHPKWISIKSIIQITSRREYKDKISTEKRYYIASAAEAASIALKKIRSHWAIENILHWILDMSFGDDQSRIRKHNAPKIMAIMKHVSVNLLQIEKQINRPRQSIKGLRKMAGWNFDILLSVLQQKSS